MMWFFYFSNTPYPDEKRWFYTRNNAFHLILKSDFDFKQQKNEKVYNFFHSLLFSTLKYDFFSGYRSCLKLPSVHAPNIFISHVKKPFGSNSNLRPVKWSSSFGYDEFYFSMIKSGRFITAAPDKIFAQTFFEGTDKGWNCGLVGVLIISGNRKCPKKIIL